MLGMIWRAQAMTVPSLPGKDALPAPCPVLHDCVHYLWGSLTHEQRFLRRNRVQNLEEIFIVIWSNPDDLVTYRIKHTLAYHKPRPLLLWERTGQVWNRARENDDLPDQMTSLIWRDPTGRSRPWVPWMGADLPKLSLAFLAFEALVKVPISWLYPEYPMAASPSGWSPRWHLLTLCPTYNPCFISLGNNLFPCDAKESRPLPVSGKWTGRFGLDLGRTGTLQIWERFCFELTFLNLPLNLPRIL